MADEIRDTDTKTVIYCKTQRETENLAKRLAHLLQGDDIPVSYYHGGLDATSRLQTQEAFTNQGRGVMIATIAFGMGIDIPDIHLLIHYGISRDIESYYQEIGRSGRDGGAGECIAFYGRGDFSLNRRFAMKINNTEHRERQLEACVTLERLIRNPECRMQNLIAYFGEDVGKPCDRCDRCEEPVVQTKPPTQISPITSYLALSALIGLEYGCGLNTLTGILNGSKSKKMNSRMRLLKEYGSLLRTTQPVIRAKLDDLLYEGFLQQQNTGKDGFTFINISMSGREWLKQYSRTIHLVLTTLDTSRFSEYCRRYIRHQKTLRKTNKPISTSTPVTKSTLHEWRRDIARKLSVPAFYVVSNETLGLLDTIRPKTVADLLSVKGIGPKKIRDYGEDLLKILQKM